MLQGVEFSLLYSALLSIFIPTYPLCGDPTCPANHASEGGELETRFTRVKDRLGKKQARTHTPRMDGGILVVGEGEGRGGKEWEANRIMETLPEWSE